MASGLYIDNDLLSLASLEIDGECIFLGLSGEQAVYLYFIPDEDSDPPLKLQSKARSLYYPGNEMVFGNILKFADHKEESYVTRGKKFKRYEILDQTINSLLTEHTDFLSAKNKHKANAPFFLIVPPMISAKLKNRLLKTVEKNIHNVRCLDYVKPAVYNLLLKDQLQTGNIMFLDLTPSDIYMSVVNSSVENANLRISILREDKIIDTDLFYEANYLVATEIVNSASLENDNDPEVVANLGRKNREILFHMPDAQDIITELNEVEEWSSVTMDFESSDGRNCSVIIYKNLLVEKFSELDGAIALTGKIDYLFGKYHPHSLILHGAYFNNPFLNEVLKNFKECKKIYLKPDYYRETCRIVLEHANIIGQLDSGRAVPGLAGKIHAGSAKQADVKQPEKARRIILAALIIIILVVFGYLGYRSLFHAEKSDVIAVVNDDEVAQDQLIMNSVISADSVEINDTVISEYPVDPGQIESKTEVGNTPQTSAEGVVTTDVLELDATSYAEVLDDIPETETVGESLDIKEKDTTFNSVEDSILVTPVAGNEEQDEIIAEPNIDQVKEKSDDNPGEIELEVPEKDDITNVADEHQEIKPDESVELDIDDIVSDADVYAHYPGGDKKMLKFLKKNLVYPYEAREQKIRGYVTVLIVVEPDGRVTDIKILKGLGGGCDEELVRVIKKMPDWDPATRNGMPVRTRVKLPRIKFPPE